MTETTAPASAPAFQGYGSKPYRAYVLLALVTVYTFNFIDRVVITIIQEPIRAEHETSSAHGGALARQRSSVERQRWAISSARLPGSIL